MPRLKLLDVPVAVRLRVGLKGQIQELTGQNISVFLRETVEQRVEQLKKAKTPAA